MTSNPEELDSVIKDDDGAFVSIEEYWKRGKIFRYKARAEMFPDAVHAFNLLFSGGRLGRYKVIKITMKSLLLGDCIFDFYTDTPMKDLQTLWDKEGKNLHRIIQTIKPYDEYDGKIDNSFYEES